MPLYDFRCRACNHEFEALVRNDMPPGECPRCRGGDLERLLSTFAVTSSGKRQTAADASRHKAAKQARRDNAATERETEHHRKEDH